MSEAQSDKRGADASPLERAKLMLEAKAVVEHYDRIIETIDEHRLVLDRQEADFVMTVEDYRTLRDFACRDDAATPHGKAINLEGVTGDEIDKSAERAALLTRLMAAGEPRETTPSHVGQIPMTANPERLSSLEHSEVKPDGNEGRSGEVDREVGGSADIARSDAVGAGRAECGPCTSGREADREGGVTVEGTSAPSTTRRSDALKAWGDDVALRGPNAPKNDGSIKHMIEYLLTVYERFGNTCITANLQWGATALWKQDELRKRVVELEAALSATRCSARMLEAVLVIEANRQELIQNGTCAYLSPRPNGMSVPWHYVKALCDLVLGTTLERGRFTCEVCDAYGPTKAFESYCDRKDCPKLNNSPDGGKQT